MLALWLGIIAAGLVEVRLLVVDLPKQFTVYGIWWHVGVALTIALLASILSVLLGLRRQRLSMIWLWLGIVGAGFVEIRLLLVDLPYHVKALAAHSVWSHVGVVLAAVLLLLTILSALFRLPVGKRRVKTRFVIKPFRTLKKKSAYSGEAIAALVFRDVLAWQSQTKGSLEAYASPSSAPQQMSVSVVGTSVPITWIWTHIRGLVTGSREIVIDGIVADDPLYLKVWTDASRESWAVELKGSALLDFEMGIDLLTPDLLRAVDPALVVWIFWNRARYLDALELVSTASGSLEEEVDAIQLCLEADLDDRAQARLDDLIQRYTRLRKPRSRIARLQALTLTKARLQLRSKVARLQAEISTRSGMYDEARTRLEEAIAETADMARCEIYTQLAENYAYSGDYTRACQAYNSANQAGWAQLSRIFSGKVSHLSQLQERARKGGVTRDIQEVLVTIHEALTGQARCRALAGADPLPYYRDAVQICDLLRESDYEPPLVRQWKAVTLKAMSQHVWPEDPREGAEFAMRAIEAYDEAIEICRAYQESDPLNVRLLTGLAWNYCGKTSCVWRLLQTPSGTATDDDSPVAIAVDRILSSVNTLPPLEQDAFERAQQQAFTLRPTKERTAGGAAYATAIAKAASRLATSLLRDRQEAEAEAVAEEWMQLSDGELGKAMDTAASGASLFSESDLNLDSADTQQKLQWQVARILNLVIASADSYDIGGLINRSKLRFTRDDAVRLCQDKFEELSLMRDAHHRTESYYGMACLAAVQMEPDAAAAYLAEAIALRGGGPTIPARARMDYDFDAIKHEPQMMSLLVGVGGALLPSGEAADLQGV